ncbi:MAG TPA: outer membrane lipoprotein carrier protein LolA [Polyangiaceae bacterium]|nr:outer membrane lipoprotein carrier protein LolA [Polyangiaceae bacterium]
MMRSSSATPLATPLATSPSATPVRRRALLVGLAAVAGAELAGRVARADEPERHPVVGAQLDALFREVAQARRGVRSFSGPFTQTRKLGLMKAKVTSQGRVTLVLPDRLRWELLPPDEVIYWVTPEGLAYRNRSSQGAVGTSDARALSEGLEDLRAMLGGELAGLRKRYDVSAFTRGDEAVFEARARASAAPAHDPRGVRGLASFSFGVGKDRARPTFASLVERNGDRSDIRFGELRLNVPVEPRTMHL